MKPKVLITRSIPTVGVEMIAEHCELEIWQDPLPPSYEVLKQKIKGKDGILCLLTDKIDADIIGANQETLKVISNYAVGFDNIDIETATKFGIPVGNTPFVLTETTADLTFALMLSAGRRIVEGADYAKTGQWKTWGPKLLLGQDIYGATLGIMGMGRIGRAVAKRAAGFGMKVIYTSRSPIDDLNGATAVDMETLLKESDFLSLHVPLTGETENIIDEKAFGQMKSTSILINTARGGVVCHQALYEALKNGQIAYAALDVTNPEPLPCTDQLYSLPNCLIIPHLGSASVATRDKMATMAAENLLAGLNQQPLPNCVNPQVNQ